MHASPPTPPHYKNTPPLAYSFLHTAPPPHFPASVLPAAAAAPVRCCLILKSCSSARRQQQHKESINQSPRTEMAPSLPSSLDSSSGSAAAAAVAAVVTVLSKCTVCPDAASALGDLKLSVSDLPMLSCHYIQKGLFFSRPPIPIAALLSLLKASLSRALSLVPALAGRLVTLPDGRIVISCDGSGGVEFSHAAAPSLTLSSLLPPSSDVPLPVRSLFPCEGVTSFDGHFRPLAAFQLTELGDGAVFIGCGVNHAVVDGTSLWNFFNAWAELCRGGAPKPPEFRRDFFGGSAAVLRFPGGVGPEVTFPVDAPLRERIFHFAREAVQDLKSRANRGAIVRKRSSDRVREAEIFGKLANDPKATSEEVRAGAGAGVGGGGGNEAGEVSSFQALCAQLWRSVTRARKRLQPEDLTTFRMAVNCRHRVRPRVAADYFGNAIQSVATRASVGEVASRELRWAAGLLHASVAAHGDSAVRRAVAEWEAAPRCFPLGNPDGAGITMGSSHRFPMYDGNDFGWGNPLAVRSGKANKFDGKISAFPGREGYGSVDLEVCLAPDAMAALLQDDEFMSYVSADN